MTPLRTAVDLVPPPGPSADAAVPPSAEPAVRRYTALAPAYDAATEWGAPFRSLAVHQLAPGPGETVLDVGCGTGLNFGSVQDRIGPSGRLIGIDSCPAMLAQARARANAAGWDNVVLICSPVELAALTVPAQAVLFCAVHDILRSPAALCALLRQVPAGSRVVAAGAKWAPWWVPGAAGINWSVRAANRPCVSSFEGFGRPWSHLAGLLPGLTVRELAFGSFYLASGTAGRAGLPPEWDVVSGQRALPLLAELHVLTDHRVVLADDEAVGIVSPALPGHVGVASPSGRPELDNGAKCAVTHASYNQSVMKMIPVSGR